MRRAGALALGMLVAVAAAGPARAYVAPGARIVSASLDRLEQGDDSTTAAAVSGDGRYVALRTQSRNLFPDDQTDPPGKYYEGGVFRRDVDSGRLELVARGDLRREGGGELLARGATAPSISGDGRWVAFSTGERLVAADTNSNIDVYVRDMSRPIGDPLAFELISAHDGASTPARYAPDDGSQPFKPEPVNPGADVATGVALSADGNRVVFRTVEVKSDLPDRVTVDTPPYQVFVRDRATRTTQLVTRVTGRFPPAPAGGATGGAAISADGSTVTWPGRNAGAQTRFLPGESPDDNVDYYLWRRVADGPSAETRRITGASDPDDSCGYYRPDEQAQGPCYGPLTDNEQSLVGIVGTLPALSGDGRRVAFVTGASPRPRVPGINLDLFLTDMSPGVTRKAGTVELTREGTNDRTASAPVLSVALSGDGRWAAVVSERTRFLLPALRVTTAMRTVPGTQELYLVDLQERTLERAARGYDGGDAGDSVAPQVTLTSDGRRASFVSAADNLFFGDANQRSDAFVIDRLDRPPPDAEPPEPPVEALEAATPAASPPGRLRVFVRRGASGIVRLDVRAPVRGRLTAQVLGRLPDRDGRPRGAARRLAAVTRRVKRPGRVLVDLRLGRRFRSVLRRERKLLARATVILTPKSGRPLAREVGVKFEYRRPSRRTRRG